METCDRNKGIPRPRLEMDPDRCSHCSQPTPLCCLPSLHWPLLGNPLPFGTLWCCCTLKIFLKAPGLTQQQRTGQSDSKVSSLAIIALSCTQFIPPPLFYVHLCILFSLFLLSSALSCLSSPHPYLFLLTFSPPL